MKKELALGINSNCDLKPVLQWVLWMTII